MATLHLVNQATALASALAVAHADDTVVLLEDGVYASTAIVSSTPLCRVAVLKPDLTIRGLGAATSLPTIDYDDLVELCTQHNPITTWC